MSGQNIRIGAAGIVTCAGEGESLSRRIVMGRRAKEPRLGQWVLPGGKIRHGETFAAALAREFREECGAELILAGGVFRVYELLEDGDEHRVVIYLLGTCDPGQLKAGSDCTEVKACTRVDLREMDQVGSITPFCREVLKDIAWL